MMKLSFKIKFIILLRLWLSKDTWTFDQPERSAFTGFKLSTQKVGKEPKRLLGDEITEFCFIANRNQRKILDLNSKFFVSVRSFSISKPF